MPRTTPRLIIHGGAGHITRANLPPPSYLAYATFLLHVNRCTRALLLERGASALDAATQAVAMLEDNELFNCGRGAVFTRGGRVELEASVMVSHGYRKRACGVVLLKHVKNPIKLAREMLIRGETDGGGGGNGGGGDPSGGSGGAQGHCILGGPTVEALARGWGLEMVDEKYFWTKKRWDEHKRGLGGEVEGEYLPQGTVGCVILDRYGCLCVATSTGGLTNKLDGRIGDTPMIGAGFWAEEWEVETGRVLRQPQARAPMVSMLPDGLKQALGDCFPGLAGYVGVAHDEIDEKSSSTITRAVAMSGTGNGDSFLRLAATRTISAIARFSPNRSLSSAVTQIAGPGGELQRSAGDRWGKTGEGEGGMIGIEMANGIGKVVYDFNCGGMFRCWVDDGGKERVMVFKEEY